MDSTKASQVQSDLVECGWPITVDGLIGAQSKEAIKDFQFGFAFIDLEVDGIAGPATRAALDDCLRNTEGRPAGRCAEYFIFKEFKSKGNGWIKVHPRLLVRLDQLRRMTGPVEIISGYRDPAHNRSVGGAVNSQHVLATASDINGVSQDDATNCGFSGIGIASNGQVVHVDVRAEGPNNTTGGEPGTPTRWYY